MAILNGIYLHVVTENGEREVDATSHPVETGIPITDTVRAKALTISISGKIVDYGNTKAAEVVSKLRHWQSTGALLDYHGRNIASNLQIRGLSTDHPNTNYGGADFSMELTQVRIAKSAYDPTATDANTPPPTIEPEKIQVGMKVVFKGGPVYKSSDAKKKAATRKRSTCKVTKISKLEYSIHQYHLKSTDGKKVNGWVDEELIEAPPATGTGIKTHAGTQQGTGTSGTAVYHKVKKGNTVYNLVTKKYSYLGSSVQWVMDNNPGAFSTPGDATTLQVGKKLLMGYKQ